MLAGEEDKQPTQAAFYQHTLMPLKRLGVTVVIIDHAGNDPSKPRGSSGKRDDVDTVWQVTAPLKNRLILHRTHQRSPHAADQLVLERQTEPLRHIVSGQVPKDEQSVVECMAAIQALNLAPGVSGRKVAVALRASAKTDGRKGFRERVVYDALRRLKGDDK